MTADAAPLPEVQPGDGLVELAVRNLGVVADLRLVVGQGMTAITGETGAGKTLLLTALELLTGGRADTVLVGPHGSEAVVSGRFVLGGEELVLERVVPADGRSRAYVNGRPATVATLAEYGDLLVEIHGQHAAQTIVRPEAQRAALDRHAGIDVAELLTARLERRRVEARLAELGGDRRERIRRAELYRYQVSEIDAVGLADADEDDRLRDEAELLADAESLRLAAATVAELLGGDGAVDGTVRSALHEVSAKAPLASLAGQIETVLDQLVDVARSARDLAESIEDDPDRLAWVQERRRALAELRRKYGDSLAEVLAYRDEISASLAELDGDDDQLAALERERAELAATEAALAAAVGRKRREAAAPLAVEVQTNLRDLALPSAELVISVGTVDPGDEVEFLLSANRGAPPAPLAKVGSGGELSRAMLALRLVLSAGPPVMVFDEVDAGVGGEAALSVGRALAALGEGRQVFVVTHLAQVAAFADHQVKVVKHDDGTKVVVDAALLVDDESRVVELSRMLSGTPESQRAQDHAAELLAEGQAVPRQGGSGIGKKVRRRRSASAPSRAG